MYTLKSHSFRSRRLAFTLIELLVVLTIIALLLALLMPAIKAARNASQKSACLSNQRQLGMAFSVYVSDHDDWLPDATGWRAAAGLNWEPNWARVLAKTMGVSYSTDQVTATFYAPEQQPHLPDNPQKYAKQNGVFQCPSDTYKFAAGGDHAAGYAPNESVLGIGDSYFFSALAVNWAPRQSYSLKKPTDSFFLGESVRIALPGWSDYNTNTAFSKDGVLDEDPHPEAGTIHMGNGNYLWGDGHANTLKPGELKGKHFARY